MPLIIIFFRLDFKKMSPLKKFYYLNFFQNFIKKLKKMKYSCLLAFCLLCASSVVVGLNKPVHSSAKQKILAKVEDNTHYLKE